MVIVTFNEAKVLAWAKNSTIKNVQTIGVRQALLYELKTKINQALVHETSNSNEIWHQRLGHMNFCALTSMGKLVTGLPKLSQIQNESCKGCALGENTKNSFLNS